MLVSFAFMTPLLILQTVEPADALSALVDVDVTQHDEPVDGARGGALLRARPGIPLVAFAAAGSAIYVVDARGDVRASLDGGRTFHAGRFPTRRSVAIATFTDECAADEADTLGDIDPFVQLQSFGFVGDNVWLDIDTTFFLRESAGELFAFPYGTTGEAYLEFTPDSPAFWAPQWINGLPRPDVYYTKTTARTLNDASARIGTNGACDELANAGIDEDVENAPSVFTLAVDTADPRIALLVGPFGRERTDDGGRTWFSAEEDDGTDAMSATAPVDAFVLTADALTRAPSPGPATTGPDADQLAAFRRMRARGPSFDDVMLGARARVDSDVNDGGAAFVPRVDLVGGSMFTDSSAVLDAVFLDATFVGDAKFVRQTAEVSTDNGENAAFARGAPMVNPFIALLLSWDLPGLFLPAASPAQRRARQERWADAERAIVDALRARDQVLEELAFRPPEGDDDFTLLLLELEETEAQISALSGVRFPPLDGRAAGARARLPATQPVASVVAQAQRHFGVADDRMEAGARAWRPAMPTLVAGGSYIDTSLDEDDFLDEIGTTIPWVTKSANGRIVELRGRLTWDLPRTLRAHDDVADLAHIRRDVALDATAAYFERRRAQASLMRAPRDRDGQLVVDELGAVLSAMTGGWFEAAENNRSLP